MAKRRRKSSGGGVKIIKVQAPRRRASFVARAPAPVIKVSAPRAAPVRRRGRRRSSGGGGSIFGSIGSHASQSRVPILLGAAALGFAHKEKWLEKLPVIGKAGPITSFGLLGWGAEHVMKMKLPKIVHDSITAALAISAFNLGFSSGQTIVGEEQPAFAYPGGAVFFD